MFMFLIRFAAMAICLLMAAGFTGTLHPVGDSLSLLRLPLGALCMFLLLFKWPRVVSLSLAVAGFAGLATTLPAIIVPQSPGDLTVYSKNLWARNTQVEAVAEDIRSTDPDVVLLQEVSRRNDEILQLLEADYPHQHLCWFSSWSGLAVLSKHPIEGRHCSGRRAVAAAQIERDGTRFWAASVHLPWPFPHANARGAQRGVSVLDQLDGPVVIGGDFNIFPWAASVTAMQRASGARLSTPLRPTYNLHGIPLFLDHISAPGGGRASYRPLLGSDHIGVLAQVRMTPGD